MFYYRFEPISADGHRPLPAESGNSAKDRFRGNTGRWLYGMFAPIVLKNSAVAGWSGS